VDDDESFGPLANRATDIWSRFVLALTFISRLTIHHGGTALDTVEVLEVATCRQNTLLLNKSTTLVSPQAAGLAGEIGGDNLVRVVREHSHTCYMGDRTHWYDSRRRLRDSLGLRSAEAGLGHIYFPGGVRT
jgi:hypothetical protein